MRILALILMPIAAFADYLTQKEIDQLVDSAFNSDKGSQNIPQPKNHERPGLWPWVIFLNVEGGDYEVTEGWMDEIRTVAAEITQLTDLHFTIMPEVKTWEETRKIVKGKPISNMIIYFSKLGGIDGRATASRTSVRIHINGQKNNNNKELYDKTMKHLIREEMTNTMGLLGDTWRDAKSIFYQGGSRTTQFTETDRRILYAYYHFDKNETTDWPAVYDEETFRAKVSKVWIDDEKVYQGLFADRLPFRPGWLYFNAYPWVYCGRSNAWYYLCAHQGGSYLWAANTRRWSLMTDVFKRD